MYAFSDFVREKMAFVFAVEPISELLICYMLSADVLDRGCPGLGAPRNCTRPPSPGQPRLYV